MLGKCNYYFRQKFRDHTAGGINCHNSVTNGCIARFIAAGVEYLPHLGAVISPRLRLHELFLLIRRAATIAGG